MRASVADRSLRFESHAVDRLHSVAHLFQCGKGRRGVYVLTFSDGDRYVGQSVDVVTRFGSHLRKVGDIVGLEFARVSGVSRQPCKQRVDQDRPQ